MTKHIENINEDSERIFDESLDFAKELNKQRREFDLSESGDPSKDPKLKAGVLVTRDFLLYTQVRAQKVIMDTLLEQIMKQEKQILEEIKDEETEYVNFRLEIEFRKKTRKKIDRQEQKGDNDVKA